MDEKVRQDLEKQGYRLVGNHSALKVCMWVKRALTGSDVCYKNTFYGIQTHRCLQSSVSLFNCLHKCHFCWRVLDYTVPKDVSNPDRPEFILDGLISAQREYLQGFRGNPQTIPERFEEAMNPKHVALSLAGDATMYPLLPGMIDEIADRGMTSFVVTNGMRPDVLKGLVDHNPTQVYVTLPAPDESTYVRTCNPLVKDGWERLNNSLRILQDFKRSTVRLTLIKGLNMVDASAYAELLDNLDVRFIELKAGMPVGHAQYRMFYEAMPRHSEIMGFAREICGCSGLKVIDEKENSRVALISKNDFEGRRIKLQ